jgi:predicted MPP superfamily phosphohydrolase
VRRFFLLLHGLTALFQIPFALAVAEALARAGVGAVRWAIAIGMAAIMVVALRGRVRLGASDRPISPLRGWLVEEPYFVHWGASVWGAVAFVLGALACGVLALASVSAWPGTSTIALFAYGSGLPIAFYAVVIRRRWVRVRHVTVRVRDLSPALEGLSIAQLSDLHIGAMTPGRRGRRWVERANAIGADVVALTGDYVTSGVAFHDEIADVFAGLRAPLGVFCVPGNHDYFGEGEPLFERLRARGIRVMRNEATTVEKDGATFAIAGVDDVWTRRADVGKTMDQVPAGVRPIVALAHDPKLFPPLADRGADVILSGHTHWGQVALPFFPRVVNFARLAFPFHSGEETRGDATLVISPGLGTTGPPIRFGSPPEITVVRLVRA